MKVKSEREVAQSCPTLSDPIDCSLPGFSVHGIFQARVTGVGCHFSVIVYYISEGTLLVTPEKVEIRKSQINKPFVNIRKFRIAILYYTVLADM